MHPLRVLTSQLATSNVEALLVCGLAAESKWFAQSVDKRQVPMKAILLTGGAYSR